MVALLPSFIYFDVFNTIKLELKGFKLSKIFINNPLRLFTKRLISYIKINFGYYAAIKLPLNNAITNYYKTDVITNASKIMSLTAVSFYVKIFLFLIKIDLFGL